MEITREQVGTTLIIKLHGKLDTYTAPQLDAEIKKGLDGVKELYWDFSELDYMTSAGIRELLIASNMLGDDGYMKVIHANEAVKNALYMTGFSDLIGE
jgi:anti-sigma B factor antagonist